jgi:signal transduction histidine kinase
MNARQIILVLQLFLIAPAGFCLEEVPSRDIETYIYEGGKHDGFLKILLSKSYSKTDAKILNLGVTNDWSYVKFKINKQKQDADHYLMIENSSIDSLFLFASKPNLKFIQFDGSNVPKNISHRTSQNFVFNLGALSKDDNEFILAVKSGKQMLIPFRLNSIQNLNKYTNSSENILILYFGIMLVLIIYNLFIFFSLRDIEYWYYVLYLFSVTLVQACLFGFGNVWFWPNSQWLSIHAIYVAGGFSGIATILFSQKFLRTKELTPFIHKLLIGYLCLGALSILLSVMGQYNLSYNLINFNAASALILLVASAMVYRKGHRSGLFFMLAWSLFLIGVTIFALKDFGILPYNQWTLYALPLGSALEGILLSFGLADRINTLKKEKEQAQERELEALKANEQKLEQKVIERTSELEMAKNEVQRNYDHLRITQRQLVEAEKLSGLGQMTAGIAHELNNPINFVSSNIAPLNRDVNEVIKFMNEFEKLPEHATQEQLDDLKAKYKDADMPYVKQEIDQLMKGISEGARRTAVIVKGLRIFARADRDALVKSNINECMDATLVVMKSTYKDDITLVKDLDPAIPELECFPGKLNQVFANLIGNAVHATRAMGRPKEQQFIWIKTWADNDNLYVSIKDNGKGMTDEVKAKIFEPFYTTKGVGEGTGLGLSISHGIIEEHKGTVSLNTKINEGTEFIIAIPRNLAQIRNLAA